MKPHHVVWAIASGAALEAWLLWRLTHHPAGGWGADRTRAFVVLLSLAALPLVGAGIIPLRAVMSASRVRVPPLPYVPVIVCGPVAIGAGLALYGHAVPLFLVVGLAAQSLAVLAVWAAGVSAGARPADE